ncbi:unnamed protein product [Acanthoscelides obtectus]|uniref:Uncharacterized protein n=1 Tax=Acanthoscelides obtectus TaxID=200917 RepID=A0A9P0LMM0_ACAOB|nr:unnamed protein product [Acanthoscelides obtectus]CAK1627578.1 hypothetical protein AOBTE_LOCUS4675 [Acanthoscelides obtectus]
MEESPDANDIRVTSLQMKTKDMCKSLPIENEFDEHQTASTFAQCASIVSPIPQLDGDVAAESARQTAIEFDDAPIIDIVLSGGPPQRNASDSCRKIIIIGDEYAKSFRKVLELYIDITKMSIKAHDYPHLEFVDITKNVFNITKSLEAVIDLCKDAVIETTSAALKRPSASMKHPEKKICLQRSSVIQDTSQVAMCVEEGLKGFDNNVDQGVTS